MHQRSRRGFSAVAVVVALGLVVTLGGVLLGALSATRVRSHRMATRARLMQLQVALAMYEADHGRYPLGSPRLDDDDAPWLLVGLTYPPALGGGVHAPYVEWSPRHVGVLQTGVGAPVVRPLTPAEQERLDDPGFLVTHAPGGPTALVFLDDRGQPLHGRSWARLRQTDRERLQREPWVRGPFDALPAQPETRAPVAHTVEDRPHTADVGWDLWSAGPNGVNEYGAPCSDDVASWPGEAPAADCTCSPGWTSARAPEGGLLALAGVAGAVGLGLLARARRRRARRPTVGLHERATATRCAFCHATDRRTPLLACTGCGAGLHLECWGDAGACPTLGCA